jgi:hypothetical protein
LDLTVQGGQSPASYMESAADWPPPITRVPRKPKVAQFCAAPWPNFTPPLTLIHLLKNKYPAIDHAYANYHPVFLCDQIKAICEFEGIPYQMRPEFIDRAWDNLFVRHEKIVH